MGTPQVKYLKDYTPPSYFVENIDLNFNLDEKCVIVESLLKMRRNAGSVKNTPLFLDGSELEIVSVFLDGRELLSDEYEIDKNGMTIESVPESFELSITTKIYPQNNTSLEGLYQSSGNFCTQCEAEGFRKITFYPDRPDVMSSFSCRIEADMEKYPVLLSNGNLIDSGDAANNRHWVKWEDPFKKPSYLFALVAGDLVSIVDSYTTASGREIDLKIYVEHMNSDKCDHAMESLKKSMRWDEKVYGREYDLDIYMIVAVNDFNMGAMENKGLNIFNSKYVLAKPETATDSDFNGVEAVIAHEYFHNWTGNRVTLKNWFQLSLKEGLTVFRDQEFSADMTSRAVKRISDVRQLRAAQFPEDAGPMAHPVRPPSYIEMNNFYTMTVYEKGAEVIRMIHTIVGPDNYRKGMDLYFDRFDGQAVTTDDFVKSMEDASGSDLTQFRLWYTQAGTPEIKVSREYDEISKTYSLTFIQSCPETPGQKDKKPMHIPVSLGLLDKEGEDIPLQFEGELFSDGKSRIINLTEKEEKVVFLNVKEDPVPSVLRGFSAPVKLNIDYTDEELVFLLANDSDSFNRWDAGQKLFSKTILSLVDDFRRGKILILNDTLIDAFRKTLLDKKLDKALIAQALTLPSESELGDMMDQIDVDGIHHVREFVIKTIAEKLRIDLLSVYTGCKDSGHYSVDNESIAKRSLKNTVLNYLGRLNWTAVKKIIYSQFRLAGNMTDEIEALYVLANSGGPDRKKSLERFYDKWNKDTLVLDKWFSIQASSKLPNTISEVKKLMDHKDFSIKNPNKVRSLIGAFCLNNPWNFHKNDGSGYVFLADQVLVLNKLNPQIAARLVSGFNKWRKFDRERQKLMRSQLERIVSSPDLSKDVFEIASKALV